MKPIHVLALYIGVTVMATCPNAARADAIHVAVDKLDCAAITKILAEEPSFVNLKDRLGRTPLLVALAVNTINRDHKAMRNVIDLLITAKADQNISDNRGDTALHYAIRDGLEIVEIFARRGAPLVNVANLAKDTPLHVAVWMHKLDIAEYLLVSGAAVNAKNKDGLAPLHVAAMKNDQAMVELLLKYNADINARTNSGQTPYTLADKAQNDDATLLRFISKHGGKQ